MLCAYYVKKIQAFGCPTSPIFSLFIFAMKVVLENLLIYAI